MKLQAVILALPALAAAYPGLMGMKSTGEAEAMLRERRAAEETSKRQLDLGGVVSGLTSTISGLLGSIAAAVDPNDKRPEPGYEFKAPGAGDSRGPCPGLNLLANYGYLPRDGYVNYGQVLEATARGFNMGADLATVLCVFAILTDGDIATESWYLGTDPNTNIGGLNRHSTIEADVSPNREDFYNGCGDNHHVSSRLFKQNVQFASESENKNFDMDVMAKQYAAIAQFSQQNNPYIYAFPFPQIVSLGAFAFYPQFFSNGTYGSGGVPNYESISSIIGAEYQDHSGEFMYVPEKWPENWYRRSVPYGAVDAIRDGFLSIYTAYPLVPAISQIGGPNLDVDTILCDVYQGINSITPLALGGTVRDVDAAVSWATGKLVGVLGDTILGCTPSALSPDEDSILYPNKTDVGGPINSPTSQSKNIGNNVYNKVYFTEAPTQPSC